MNRNTPEFDQRIADWLEADPTTAPGDVISTVAAALPSIPQARRGLLAPWRFTEMSNLARAAVAVAIVAIVGVGVLAFNLRAPTTGSSRTPTPSTVSPAPGTASPGPASASPAVTGSANSWPLGRGITAWTSYTSEVYGVTLGYPDGWSIENKAKRKWRAGDGAATDSEHTEFFINPEARDGEQIAFGFRQMPAGAGADVTSREGLAAWAEANGCDDAIDACDTVPDVAMPMCVGREACLPAVLVPLSDGTSAYFVDAESGLVTVVSILRPDAFPAAARYGGSVQLLKSILATMDVWPPEPGQVPAGG